MRRERGQAGGRDATQVVRPGHAGQPNAGSPAS
jgi:hypothetical protein